MDATNEANGVQTAISLSERFDLAYKRVPYKLRPTAQAEFCRVHGIAPYTFNAKRRGDDGYSLTETEVIFMEKYSPYDNGN